MFNLVQILDEARISHSVKNERLRYKVAKQGYISEKGIGAWPRDVYSHIKEVKNSVQMGAWWSHMTIPNKSGFTFFRLGMSGVLNDSLKKAPI